MLRFYKNNTKQVSEKARKSMRLFYITAIWMFAFIVFELTLPHSGYAATFTVNELVTFTPRSSTFQTTSYASGCPTGFAGKFSFDATLANKSSSPPLSNLVVGVSTLTNGNLLQNADGGSGGEGARLTVPKPEVSDFSDGILSRGEFVDVPFVICLRQLKPFTFIVNVLREGEPIVLVLPQPDSAGFDRELFVSDGSNTSEVFDAGSHFQATFRLARSEGGEQFVSDWNKFLQIVNFVKNAADSEHGIPLLITKATFITAGPVAKTFFMAAFAATTIFHQDITILSSPAFQLSSDPVESIQLQVEGATIEVNPIGNTPVQFSSGGEKTVIATVRFASGFVGQNLFRLVVEVE